MKKLNKKAFTLVEMVLVLAIIVILSAVFFAGISGYVMRARNATASIEVCNAEVEQCVTECDAA